MKSTQYQPKTGQACSCKPGKQRDNCTRCEGTGSVIDFAAIRNKKEPTEPQPEPLAGSYRTADGRAQIEWTLERGENGLKFSASGTYGGGSGQCIDSIAKAYPNDATIQRIAKVWALYHLNDMKAGTPEQHAEIERAQVEAVNHVRGLADGKKYFYDAEMTQPNWHYLPSVFGFDSYFDWECATLRKVGLYEVQIKPGMKATGGFPPEVVAGKRGYHFGERWIFSEIPADVVNEIKSWQAIKQPAESLPDYQAAKFLKDNRIKMLIELSETKSADWSPSGKHYRVTVRRSVPTVKRFTFDFWGSAADAEAGRAPTVADVLDCLASDINTPDDFEAFCSEYGFDSRKAHTTWRKASALAKNLRAFFTAGEVESLQTLR